MNANFYCKFCHRDFSLPAAKGENRYGKWLYASCPSCDDKLIRYLTDAKFDPYYKLSPKIKKEREEYRKDLIQFDDPEFKLFYKKQWEKMEALKEKLSTK